MPLDDHELRELFAELAEPLPHEQLTEQTKARIRKLTAEANLRPPSDISAASDLTKTQNIKTAPNRVQRKAKGDDKI
ncbi:MAG TPA: hypothetical protein VGG72_28760 [Bryobacteraceae bacterium]|jgi:hypothetical protein